MYSDKPEEYAKGRRYCHSSPQSSEYRGAGSSFEAWRAERRQIDAERIKRQRTAAGSWSREWDRNKPLTSQQELLLKPRRKRVRRRASVTRVTEGYRERASPERTCRQDKRRRQNSRSLEIIDRDHWKLQSSAVPKGKSEREPPSSGTSFPNSLQHNVHDITSNITYPNVSASERAVRISGSIKKVTIEVHGRREDATQEMEHRLQSMEEAGIVLREQMALLREAHVAERKHDQQLHARRNRKRLEKREREASEQRQRNKEWRMLIENMVRLQSSFAATYKDISSALESCKYRSISGPVLGPHSAKLKELGNCMEQLVARATHGQLTGADVATAEDLVKRSERILNTFKFEIDRINEQSEPQFQSNSAAPPPPQVSTETDNNEECKHKFLDEESLQLYWNSQKILECKRVSCSFISESETMKGFRFECKKAVVTPVNTISNISGDHLRERYHLLYSTLAGKGSFNPNQHPQGLDYCKHLLAKQFVSQGENQIAIKPDSAFPFAAVAVALWSDYPDFGELLLGIFHKTCPYLVPIFLIQQEGQSDEEYYKSLGYLYQDGVVETQHQYLKRMSGVMRLYAAIIITQQRRCVNRPHPHGLEMALRWLESIMNIEPKPAICATLILDVLEVAGNALWRVYPKQFPELLVVLATRYYPKMKSLNDETAAGPIRRLEDFLQKCMTEGFIPPPYGVLSDHYW